MTLDRRNLLLLLGATVGSTALGLGTRSTLAQSLPAEEGPFQMLPLPYPYESLEPYIDAETMRFHYGKHYAGYTRNLNNAVSGYPELKAQSAEASIANLDRLPEKIRTTVRNNGGGYVNHTLFWQIMTPNGGGQPSGAIATAIERRFGSFAAFQAAFNQAGSQQFGSGWVWLVLDGQGQLQVTSTPNQDSPLMAGLYPLMGNDVWEHAYYLKYRNDRGKYLEQWWNVVNWEEVNRRFLNAPKTS